MAVEVWEGFSEEISKEGFTGWVGVCQVIWGVCGGLQFRVRKGRTDFQAE